MKSNVEAIEVVLEAITQAGYKPGEQIAIALDPAASEFYDSAKKKYVFKKSDKSEHSSEDMVKFWADWVRQYPIVSLEDGFAEDDWEGWKMETDELGSKIQLVGDDIFVTNIEMLPARHRRRHRQLDSDQAESDWLGQRDHGRDKSGSSEPLYRGDFAPLGRDRRHVHRRLRGGDRRGQIKTGSASRTDRIAKYNQLLRIEEELGPAARYLGLKALNYRGELAGKRGSFAGFRVELRGGACWRLGLSFGFDCAVEPFLNCHPERGLQSERRDLRLHRIARRAVSRHSRPPAGRLSSSQDEVRRHALL